LTRLIGWLLENVAAEAIESLPATTAIIVQMRTTGAPQRSIVGVDSRHAAQVRVADKPGQPCKVLHRAGGSWRSPRLRASRLPGCW
jgi:hypothetical protein